jgi:hypothetical protein
MLESITTESDGGLDKDEASMGTTGTNMDGGGDGIVAHTLCDTYGLLDATIPEGTGDNGVVVLRMVGDIGATYGDGDQVLYGTDSVLCAGDSIKGVDCGGGALRGYESGDAGGNLCTRPVYQRVVPSSARVNKLAVEVVASSCMTPTLRRTWAQPVRHRWLQHRIPSWRQQ